jgi:hypothetical protein
MGTGRRTVWIEEERGDAMRRGREGKEMWEARTAQGMGVVIRGCVC